MNVNIYFCLFLALFMSACSDNLETSKINPKKLDHVSSIEHPYFTQDQFEWSLITPDGVPLYVFEVGHGKKIVALHGGFGMEHSYMRSFLKPYEENFHIIYYDQRGSLRSPVPENDYEEYVTMENMVNDLDLLREAIGEEKLTIIAHSMGAVLAYEYMRKHPESIEEVMIISGFVPKFPSTKAEFNDMFLSQQEREAFKNRPSVQKELEKLNASLSPDSPTYPYLNWKIQYASCQIYNIQNWQKVEGGLGFFNANINKLIGPEGNIPWIYTLKFFWYNWMFEHGGIDTNDEKEEPSDTPINYLPEIKNHSHKITYLLGRYEVGDWNLRLYHRFLANIDHVDMYVFEKSCHNIWMDQPKDFHDKMNNWLNHMSSSK